MARTLRPSAISSSVSLALLLGAGSVACGGAPGSDPASNERGESADPGASPDDGWQQATVDDLDTVELKRVGILRRAIGKGLDLGKHALADEVNIVLGDHQLTTRYEPSLETGVDYVAPAQKTCPFLQPAQAAESKDCRALVTMATVSAYAQLSNLKAAAPLDASFDELREESEFWYDEGLASGIDNEAVLAVHGIRAAGACDQAPEPVKSAYEAGVERGRQIYIDQLNLRLAEAGLNMTYPHAITQITQCTADTSLLEPARSRALDEAAGYATANPLCPDFQPTTLDEIAARDDAELQFSDGIEHGVQDEHGLAAETIFEVVPCNVGDPLVLDVAGDGVALEPVTRSTTRFDLYGTGTPVRVAWIRGDDAFLVLDRDGDGVIESGRELFGNFVGATGFDEVPTGFDHLRRFDAAARGGNEDGRISSADAIYGELRLWQDRDGDGISRPDELATLAALGVESIDLAYTEVIEADPQLTHRARFVRNGAPGSLPATGYVYDAWLRHAQSRRAR